MGKAAKTEQREAVTRKRRRTEARGGVAKRTGRARTPQARSMCFASLLRTPLVASGSTMHLGVPLLDFRRCHWNPAPVRRFGIFGGRQRKEEGEDSGLLQDGGGDDPEGAEKDSKKK